MLGSILFFITKVTKSTHTTEEPSLFHNRHIVSWSIILSTILTIVDTYWPFAAKDIKRDVLYKYIECNWAESRDTSDLMSQLPATRVQVPFYSTGLYRFLGTSNRMTIKVYLCVFICLVNLELTTNLTMESFLNCFKCLNRFLSHREIYSDGTNFVDSWNELHRVFLRKINNQFMISQNRRRHWYTTTYSTF